MLTPFSMICLRINIINNGDLLKINDHNMSGFIWICIEDLNGSRE
ncbi:hypothetical protein D083_0224 [Dickeya solani RNS 08.23.3.1.A]|nr:hypothetical protein D083_0224 [Dickeya solani RNS 08.23.3.1.A]